MSDEEVTRLLIPAESEQPDVDAWNIATLPRPRGATEAEWRLFAAYGPMRLDEAHEFLSKLGCTAVSVEDRSEFPILESLNLPPAEVMMRADDDSPLPRATALVTQLNREYGSEYTRLLSLAVQDASHGYQHSYMAGLNAAIDVLTRGVGDRPRCRALAINHVGLFLTEIRADLRTASHGGAVPDMPPPTYRRSEEERP
ncbi:hypothetical protein [Nocardia alni]|uniref:hypothetical protein n=1 Tax=Nocardia alni TaxID=2815723 RepID=UPI001C235719|nr:hypothetical protein [Nocardia alni]